ncbi:MAG TPA: nitroreductase family protein [Candidatus Binataceae bacterium]|jgi:nitroreductase|nr:nitroreductase family protein [Candidatus Binataceae bacterium]
MSEIGLFEAIHSARAIRHFRPDPVPNDLISQILDAAIQAPSAGNNQNWLFVVVTDADRRRRLGDIFRRASVWVREKYNSNSRPAHINDAQYKKFWASGVYLHEHMGDAPLLLLPCLKVLSPVLPPTIPPEIRAEMVSTASWMAGASIYPAVQNIILACRALGLGTTITTNHVILEAEVKSLLDLPEEVRTFALMPIGYTDDKFGGVRRRPLGEVAVLDRYGNPWQS